MDITNIPQNLIKALEQKNTEQLAALSRVLNLVLGKTVMATVTSTAPVTEPERQALLKQTAAALAQLNKQVVDPAKISPALKAEISRLMQQQDLIKMPELKWVNLLVNNRPQVTYTDRPLAAGQSIPIQLQSPNKLVLLDLPELNNLTANKSQTPTQTSPIPLPSLPGGDKNVNQAVNIPIPNAKNIAILNELLKNTLAESNEKPNQAADIKNLQTNIDASGPGKNNAALTNSILEASSKPAITNTALYNAKDLALKFSSTPDNKSISPETAAAKTLVSENLRNLLPHRDTPNVLFSAIAQLRQFPSTSRLQLFSPSVEQALKSVAEKMRAPDTLSQPKALAQALKNSGVFFEHKLNQLAQSSIVSSGDAAKFSGTLHNTYHQDLKGSLLTLLNRVTQDITGDKRPITNEQTQKILQQVTSAPLFSTSLSAFALNSKHDLSQAIGVFIQQLMQKPVKELSNKELRTQLLTLLQQHSVHSLARIQLQQLHAINHELENKDSTTPTASWQLEIPVKHQNDVHHLHMRIDREWVDDKNESKSNTEKNNNKIKQWSVTLRFDLPTLGEFCAQLAIVNTQVSATLWAAQEKTFTQVRDQIEGLRKQLESEGMSVKYLQCMRGIPPEKPMSLSYSLIDIST